ncbi:unnamed protein product [Bursaphelenchus xylophilus]|uniref:(pine wood nematode) hypothetical protein n=1 Tax=Bursaphelenchus xylophilus TaxID=6326 RepID=A0A1I7RLR5_BURXY|nr:unnamed protein product [Bursaphelenchus xylophilus]CAG9082659.1 unnamed protein product [Bursaphelenchus xylophilus]
MSRLSLTTAALVVLSIGSVLACQPGAAGFQARNPNIRCLQCQPIHIQPGCDPNFHDSQFACAFPTVVYNVARPKTCARATIYCNSVDFQPSNAQILAKVFDLTTNETVWIPFGPIKLYHTYTTIECGDGAGWKVETTADQVVVQPLFIRCAHSALVKGNAIDQKVVDVLEGSGEQ